MGLIIYGHSALDTALRNNDLGRTGSVLGPRDWPHVLADVAPPFYDYAEAERGVVLVGSPMLKLYSSAATNGSDFAEMAVRAAQSIRDTLAEDRRHKAVFGDDQHGLVYPIDLEKHVATGDGFPGIDPGMRLAVVRVPHWVHPDAWKALPRDTQMRNHTTDYGWILDQISRAWNGA
ncbi:hypothetical protein ABZ897_50715 [Nonomuraea sp. NPDC046802]|uniref:hypothetical protein n=1 Tax=Nonomuraea sp. NPDC046802 TaxID=3154919 RepID=UPI0033F8C77E